MKILIAVDESEYTQAIVDFVVKSQWSASNIIVLNVVDPLKINSLMAVLPGPILDEMVEKNLQRAKTTTTSAANQIRSAMKSCQVREEILEGKAAQVILELAQEWRADLIVMGSHGKTGFSKLLLGSVSLAVTSHASCSVLIVRLKSDPDLKMAP